MANNTKPVGVAYSDPDNFTPAITGGSIDGASVGVTMPSTGAFTTVNATLGLGQTSGTVAAAGSDNTDAVAITTYGVLVTGANATKGAILPAAAAGKFVLVKNDDAANAILKVYPPSGAKINALTTTTGALSMAAKTSAIFWFYSATQIYTIPLLPS
jgi:hypothetical protein